MLSQEGDDGGPAGEEESYETISGDLASSMLSNVRRGTSIRERFNDAVADAVEDHFRSHDLMSDEQKNMLLAVLGGDESVLEPPKEAKESIMGITSIVVDEHGDVDVGPDDGITVRQKRGVIWAAKVRILLHYVVHR